MRRNILAVNVGIARFPQTTLQEEVNRLCEVRRVLRIDVLDTLASRKRCQSRESSRPGRTSLTLSPLRALLPLLKKFSFPNKSSWRWSAPAKLSMTCTICDMDVNKKILRVRNVQTRLVIWHALLFQQVDDPVHLVPRQLLVSQRVQDGKS